MLVINNNDDINNNITITIHKKKANNNNKKKQQKESSEDFPHTHTLKTSTEFSNFNVYTFIEIYLSFVCFSCKQVMFRFYWSLYEFKKYCFNIFLALLCDSEVASVFNLLCRKFHEEAALLLLYQTWKGRIIADIYIKLIVYFLIIDTNHCKRYLHY